MFDLIPTKDSSEHVLIVNVHSKLLIEILGGIDAEGVSVVQNIDFNNFNQHWALERVR